MFPSSLRPQGAPRARPQRRGQAHRAGARPAASAERRPRRHRAPNMAVMRALVPALVALASLPGSDCVPAAPAFAGPTLLRPLPAPRRSSPLQRRHMLMARAGRAGSSGRLTVSPSVTGPVPPLPLLPPFMLRRSQAKNARSAVPRQMLAANSGKLMGERDGPAGPGSDYDKVQLSAREIWEIMAPTDPALRVRVVLSVVLLVLCRMANVMVPLTFKRAVDILTEVQAGAGAAALTASAPLLSAAVATVGCFFLWKLTQGLGEVLRQYIWVAVQSDLKRRVSERLLKHLHNLSIRFHVTSKSGQTLQIMDKGTSALESLMEILPFRLFPALCDVLLVCGIFCALDKPQIAAIAGGTILVYASLTYVVTKWRTKYWREMVKSEIAYKGRAVESLQNVETVKYFAAEAHELGEYSGLIKVWQGNKQRSERTLATLNACQKLVICFGVAAVMYVSVGMVARGAMTVGDLVMTTTYMEQLYTPLTWLGTIYRMTEDSLVDMERMFKLLKYQPEVTDAPAAPPLNVTDGAIQFDEVSFSYDGGQTPVLRNVSFSVAAGQTLALVGTSGGGKSTVGRLLFRLYDVQGGAIRIDGQDIRNISQRSLRAAIGVVPQETTLWNNALSYNIRYGAVAMGQEPDAEQVENAARLAQLHERVLGWAEGYQTGVGEKGMRLSGGEKQRVGIARTFIKNPRIVLLDEATSALDSQTEEQIQEALAKAVHGRTAIVIAHRLSTVVNADTIVVLKDGRLVESGRHLELLERRGEYYAMWMRQASSQGSAASLDGEMKGGVVGGAGSPDAGAGAFLQGGASSQAEGKGGVQEVGGAVPPPVGPSDDRVGEADRVREAVGPDRGPLPPPPPSRLESTATLVRGRGEEAGGRARGSGEGDGVGAQ